MPNALLSLGRAWDKVELMIGGLFLTLSVVLIVTEIAGRSLFGSSMVGSDEIASFAVIWSVFFTASIAVKRNMHVRIDIIFTVVPATVARWLDCFGTTLSFLFAAYLMYSGAFLAYESWFFGEITMTMLRLPLWIPQLILPIGGFLLAVRLLQRLVHVLRATPEQLQREASHIPSDSLP